MEQEGSLSSASSTSTASLSRGVDNPGFEPAHLDETPKSSRQKEAVEGLTETPTRDAKAVEAVNLELVNLKPVHEKEREVTGAGDTRIPVKKEDDGVVGTGGGVYPDSYDEYFVPVNEHRKYMRGEKLYVTKDKRRPESRRKCFCWAVGFIVLAICVLVAVLAGTGVITGREEPTDSRRFGQEAVVAAGVGGAGGRNDLTSTTPSPSTAPPRDTPTTDMTAMYVPRALEGELVLDNMDFSAALSDPNSPEYKALAAALEEEISGALFDSATLRYGSADIVTRVLQFTAGSVVVRYRVAWVFKEGVTRPPAPLDTDSLRQRMEHHLSRHAGFLDTHHVSAGSVRANNVMNQCQFSNGACSHTCQFDYASMLDFKCTCPEHLILSAKDNKTCVDAADEPKAEPEPTSEPEPTAEPKSEPEPTSEPEPSSKPEPSSEEPKAEPEPTSEPEPSAEPEPASEHEPKAVSEPAAEPEPTSEPEPTADHEPSSSAEPEPAALEEPKAEPEPTSEPEPSAEPGTKHEDGAKPEPSAEPEPTSEPEPAAKQEVTLVEPKAEPEPASEEPKAEPEPTSEDPGNEHEHFHDIIEPEEPEHIHSTDRPTTSSTTEKGAEPAVDVESHPTTSEEPTSLDKSASEENKPAVGSSTESHFETTTEHKVYLVPIPIPGAQNESKPENLTSDSSTSTTEKTETREADLWDNDGADDFDSELRAEHKMKHTKEESADIYVVGKDSTKEGDSKTKDFDIHKSKDEDSKSKSKGKKSKPRPELSEDPRVELSAAQPVISRDGDFWDRVHPEATTTMDVDHEVVYHGNEDQVDTHEDPRIAIHPAPVNKTRHWFEEFLYPENDAANDLHDDHDVASGNDTSFPLGKLERLEKSEKKAGVFEQSRQLGAGDEFVPKTREESDVGGKSIPVIVALPTTEGAVIAEVTTEDGIVDEVEATTLVDEVTEGQTLGTTEPSEPEHRKIAMLNITEKLATPDVGIVSTTSEAESLEEEDMTLNPLWLKHNATGRAENSAETEGDKMFLETHLAHLIPYANDTDKEEAEQTTTESSNDAATKSSVTEVDILPGSLEEVTTMNPIKEEESSTIVAEEMESTVMYVYDVTTPSTVQTTLSSVETTPSSVETSPLAFTSSSSSETTPSSMETTPSSVETTPLYVDITSSTMGVSSPAESSTNDSVNTNSILETTAPAEEVTASSDKAESSSVENVAILGETTTTVSESTSSKAETTHSVDETTPSKAETTPSEVETTPSFASTTPESLESSPPVTTPPRVGLAEDSAFGDALDYSEADVENRVLANVSAEAPTQGSEKSDRLGLAAGVELDQEPEHSEEPQEVTKLSAFQRKLAAAREKDKDDEAAKKKRKKEKDRQAEFAAKLAAKTESKKEAGSSEEGTMGTSEKLVRPLSEGLEPAIDVEKKEIGEKKVFKGPETLAKCSEGQWRCANGTARDGAYCIASRQRCDSTAHCSDQSDEAGCGGGAGCAGNFQCGSGECLARSRVCDGAKDCTDGADEADCESWSCQPDEFACTDRRCLPLSSKCDGIPDCADHGDEVGCQATCSDSEFLCPEGWCIPSTLRCDGRTDCTNGEDEQACECSAEEFRCVRGGCVSQQSVCDGTPNCADGSDEWRCLRLPRDTGRLEIRDWTSSWQPVCSDGWSSSWSDSACLALGLSRAIFTEHKPSDGALAFRTLAGAAAGTALTALTNASQCSTGEVVTMQCQEFTCGSHGPADGVAARLAGGDAASTGQWPSVALLYHTKRHLSCAASIVAPGWVIASRACLAQAGVRLSARDWAVFAGGAAFDAGARPDTQIAQVAAITSHTGRWNGDLALARLEAPLRFGRGVGAVCLPETDIKPRQLCVTAGWDTPTAPGAVTFGRSLRWRPVPTLASAECNATRIYDGALATDEICAGFTDQADQPVCHDESGAPLMCVSEAGAWELHGLLVRDGNCERRRRPSVFVSVSAARDWINSSIGV